MSPPCICPRISSLSLCLFNSRVPFSYLSISLSVLLLSLWCPSHLSLSLSLCLSVSVTHPSVSVSLSLSLSVPLSIDAVCCRFSISRVCLSLCPLSVIRLQGEEVLLITEAERSELQDQDDEIKLLKKKKTRVLGNMRFIGELFLRRALGSKVLNDVVQSLVFSSKADSFPDEHFIECLTELLTTIGK